MKKTALMASGSKAATATRFGGLRGRQTKTMVAFMRRLHVLSIALWCLVPFFLAAPAAATQIRISPQARLQPGATRYNLRMGSLRLGMSGETTLQYSDNVTYVRDSSAKISSWSLIPSLTLNAYWPLSPYLQVDSHVTVGYRYYFDGKLKDDWFVAGSDGALTADISGQYRFWRDHMIQVRNRFSREIESLDIAARGRADGYALSRNITELQYSRALRPDTTLDLQYAHARVWANRDMFAYLDYVSNSLDGAVLYQLTRRVRIGPYARWESFRFPERLRNDRVSYEAGVTSVGSFTLGNVVTYSASFGYEHVELDSDNDPTATDDRGGFTARFETAIRPTLFPGHRVRASYRRNHTTANPGVNYADELLLGYGMDFFATSKLRISSDLDWLNISESDGGENANLWRFYTRTSYSLTPNLDLSAGYRYTYKTSNMRDREYTQNSFHLTIRHQF